MSPSLSCTRSKDEHSAVTAASPIKGKRLALAFAIAAISSGAHAGPDGGIVIDGDANIHHYGNTTDINQHTQNTTIVWDNFDIDVNEIVNFLQPNETSIALNRVFSADGTQINGQLNANGRVFVLDANGVLFGQDAKVNVGSLVASTLDLSHDNYEHLTFTGNGSPASVLNFGEITVADAGAVALLGGRVSNYGVIQAKLGNVTLAAGNQITLDFAGDGLLNVQVDGAALNALAANHGLIQANGGQILMTAHASNALLQTVVNNTGVIEAQTLQEQDGKILLLGGMTEGTGGTVRVGGTLDASAPESGNGGFIETSGSIVKVAANATLDTSSATGNAGTWLLDPTNLEISYSETGGNNRVSHVHTQALQNSLAGGNVILETADAGGQAGNITIVDPIIWASGNTLTLDAHGGITFNDYLHAPAGGLTLNAVGNITTGVEGHINVDTFTLNSGNFSQIAATLPTFMADDFVINGGTFTRATGGSVGGAALQIADIFGLQGLDTTPGADAVLVNDIDASGTSGWNGGDGFDPIGDAVDQYTGTFDGAGHLIDGLEISRAAEDNVGLFGYIGAAGSVATLGVENANVDGGNSTGILAGRTEGTITNAFTTGAVNSSEYTGGLAGASVGTISNVYSTAQVTGANSGGGLLGYNDGSVSDAWSSGDVGNMAGYGFIGINDTNGTIERSYFDTFTSGLGSDTTGGGTGNATAVDGDWSGATSAYNQASYEVVGQELDFTNDWFIAEGSSRPMLRAFLDGGNISNLYQLQGMAASVNDGAATSYTLLNNIDASATSSTDNADVWGGRGFAPVGHSTAFFNGSLDGQGFVIEGLTIDRPDQDYVGLFGRPGVASITNVGLIEGSITGNDYVGGLVGRLAPPGDISSSYATVTVSGARYVGGLVGRNLGDISSSYASGTVDGVESVGGLVGRNLGDISSSYATGAVTGDSSVGGLLGSNGLSVTNSYATGAVTGNSDVGGLVGASSGSETDSYWDIFTTGQATSSGGGIGLTGDWSGAENAYNAASYTGFNFSTDWFIAEGSSRPMLRAFLSGGGEIHNLYDLQGMAADLAGDYTLMADLDLTGVVSGSTADVWGGRGFAPVGDVTTGFSGSLDGNNYTINALAMDRNERAFIGLFGHTESGSTISNLALTDVDIEGDLDVGTVAGFTGGSISNVYISGDVQANTMRAGGLVSTNNGSITDSYANVNTVAMGGSNAGLVSINTATGTITRSYAVGSTTGGTAGLVDDNQGTLQDNFWNTDVEAVGVANGDAVGATGLTTAEFMDPASFAAWGANIDAEGGTGATWRIYEGQSAPLLRSFLTEVDVVAYDDYKMYDGVAYNGLHDINATTGAGVRYGNDYAEFVSVFGEDGTPYSADDINSADLEYAGDSQGAIDAGTYDITPSELWSSQTGYDIVMTDGVLTIDAAVVSITVSINDASKEYGESDPSFSWRVTSGSLGAGDTLTGSLFRDPGEDVGTYDIHGNITGDLATANYSVTLNEGVFTITPRAISISVDDLSKIYGDLDPELTYSVTGSAVNGDSLSVTLSRDEGEDVGSYAINADVSGDVAGSNYNLTIDDGVLNITPREVTISIADLAKIYGEDDPTLAWAVTEGSLAPGETLEGMLSRDAGENVGDYAIMGELSGALASDNYTVTLNDGVLSITPRPIVISADDLVKIYGEADPTLTYSQSGEPAFDETMEISLAREDGSDVGLYTITPTVTGDVLSDNYALSVNNGTLQVTPAALTVTADDLETYWNLLPDEFAATLDGLTNGDTEQDVFGNSLVVTTDLTLPIPGEYTLTPVATLASNNYTVTFNDGVLNLLSSNPGNGYGDGLTSTQFPARESLGGDNRANIYEGRDLLDGALDEIALGVMQGGTRMSAAQLADIGLPMPRAVLFPINSADISDMYVEMLERFVQKLDRYPDLTLLIEGHTSSTGPLWLNQRLARQRAMAVYNLLIELGVNPAKMGTKGFDWKHPVADNSTLEGRALNRRTEITPDKPHDDVNSDSEGE
ncbi:MBG domain-containing protein [Gilvimarinus sp. SDUM040013]|uniref:MBG domain-containing protein n=1 Tax=Gilvimarinus gilvus TaxID=3058038 RepID=A0ABU4S102_9GAMM|nr:MBG domain-containing protein [Gilvimarinus sp. SDUM040013]MDO3387655.1 MBG domain-containing protein [Gilvimarinus sp. SDUM040013]MDX6848904.1 MBG domain-containing protein [Gilvimarinus sp. SDUM040013]